MSPFGKFILLGLVLPLVGGWFILHHIVLILLVNAPPNPVKLRHMEMRRRYVEPLFAQDWHLFSPVPASDNIYLHLKCRLIDRATGARVESPWTDITTPLYRNRQEQRISSVGLWLYLQRSTHTARSLSPSASELILRLERANPEHPLLKSQRSLHVERRRRSDQLTSRLASAYATTLYSDRYEILETRIRTVIHEYPRFSQRNNADARGRYKGYQSEWMPYRFVAGSPPPRSRDQ